MIKILFLVTYNINSLSTVPQWKSSSKSLVLTYHQFITSYILEKEVTVSYENLHFESWTKRIYIKFTIFLWLTRTCQISYFI